MGKICSFCGKPSGIYALCFDCIDKKNKGIIVKDSDGKWVEATKNEDKKINNCIICGNDSKYDLCYDCYKEKENISRELEGSTNTLDDTKDYYNNLKYNIYKLKNMEYAKTACLKLIALGETLAYKYKQNEYIDKSKKDAVDLLKKKEEYLSSKKKTESIDENIPDVKTEDGNVIKEEKSTKDEILDYRRVYPMNFRCKDGHYVRSKSEKMIADYLFDKRIIFIYEKKVINEENDEEYYPDFYLIIPLSNGQEIGIYLEFFGLENDKKYMATELKKLEYYKSQNFEVIEVREKNVGNLEDYLDDKILKIKRKYK